MSDFLSDFNNMSSNEANGFEKSNDAGYGGNNNSGNGNNNGSGGHAKSWQGSNNNNGNGGGKNWGNNQGGGNHSGNGGNNGDWKNKQGGGNKDWKGGGNKDWKARQDEIKPPYMPIVIYFPTELNEQMKQNVHDSLFNLAKTFIEKGFTVRFNAEDKALFDRIQGLSRTFSEGYTPFKDFNEIPSGFCWKNGSTEAIAKKMFGERWVEGKFSMPQTMAERNARLLFGSRNNSGARILVTWTPDGVTKAFQCSKDTGYTRSIIEMADKFHFPVFNMNNNESREAFHSFYLEGNKNEQR